MDNHTLDGNNDKMGKVALLYDSLNGSFVKYGFFHKYLSVYVSMVPYFQHHSCKMFIRSQPTRFGYKIWCLCWSDGYPYHFTIYTGKRENSSGRWGSCAVNEKVDVIAEHSDPLKQELFFDNFFHKLQSSGRSSCKKCHGHWHGKRKHNRGF